jgi:hypothetical protein
MHFDQLVELPEWLCGDARPEVTLVRLLSRVEQGEEGRDGILNLEAELSIRVQAYVRDCVNALTDAYSSGPASVELQRQELNVCWEIRRSQCVDTAKGTVLLSENAPGVGTVLAVRALPNVGGWNSEGARSIIDGVLELTILYMPAGSDQLASAQAELPFSISCSEALPDDAWVKVEAVSAEATALMSDRLDVKVSLSSSAEARVNMTFEPVTAVAESQPVLRRSGIVIVWPEPGDSAWSIGKRYSLPVNSVVAMNNGQQRIEPGKAIVLKI